MEKIEKRRAMTRKSQVEKEWIAMKGEKEGIVVKCEKERMVVK
jgi:hypothetical protein